MTTLAKVFTTLAVAVAVLAGAAGLMYFQYFCGDALRAECMTELGERAIVVTAQYDADVARLRAENADLRARLLAAGCDE